MTMSPSELTYQTLRRAIGDQTLRPGMKLPEDELGGHFGISRTLVRTVLTRLRTSGLVDKQEYRTATVSDYSLNDAVQTFRVFKALGREMIHGLHTSWSNAAETTLSQQVLKEQSAEAGGDIKVLNHFTSQFFIQMAELAGNALIAQYIPDLVLRVSLVLAKHDEPLFTVFAFGDHEELVRSLQARNVEESERLMEAHLAGIERRAISGYHRTKPVSLRALLSGPAAASLAE